jgi:hypothetical protein
MRHDHSTSPQGDRPQIHGMLMVGEKTIYFVHLPMFDPPVHSYQVIMEGTLTREAHAAYLDARKRTGSEFYTLGPSERFALPDLVSSDPAHPPRRSFHGTAFVGVFDMGGQKIGTLQDIEVKVANVVYFQKLDPQAQPLPHLKYLLFGKEGELFLAHLITRKPDFDQVLSVEVVDHGFSDEELRRGVPTVFPGRQNSAKAKIQAGEQVSGEAQIGGENVPIQIRIKAGAECYFDDQMLNG